MHTEVDPAAEGHGVGSRLAAGALDDIRSRGLSILVVCPFVREYVRRHPEYADLKVDVPIIDIWNLRGDGVRV